MSKKKKFEYLGKKGPWSSSKQKGNPGHCSVAQVWDNTGKSLAVIEPSEIEIESSATARLMAAAYTMFEELKHQRKNLKKISRSYRLNDDIAEMCHIEIFDELDRIKRVLKKATNVK